MAFVHDASRPLTFRFWRTERIGQQSAFAQLLYGTGMRISEGLRLRVQDVDFERRTIIVREGKGGKDRALMLPQRLIPALREQLARARVLWSADQAEGRSGVELPTVCF